jgi:hypothetical protein
MCTPPPPPCKILKKLVNKWKVINCTHHILHHWFIFLPSSSSCTNMRKKILGERARLQWQYNNTRVWSILLGNGENIVESFDQQAMQSNPIRCKKTKRVATKQGQSIYKSIMRKERNEERKNWCQCSPKLSLLQEGGWWLVWQIQRRSRVLYCEFVGAHWQLH